MLTMQGQIKLWYSFVTSWCERKINNLNKTEYKRRKILTVNRIPPLEQRFGHSGLYFPSVKLSVGVICDSFQTKCYDPNPGWGTPSNWHANGLACAPKVAMPDSNGHIHMKKKSALYKTAFQTHTYPYEWVVRRSFKLRGHVCSLDR